MEVAAWFLLWGLAPTVAASFGVGSSNNKPPSATKKDGKAALKATPSSSSCNVFGVQRNIEIPEAVFPSETELKKLEESMPPHEHGWFPSCYRGSSKTKSTCYQLHYRKWLPTGKRPKAVVIFMHGISTHSGKAFCLTADQNATSSTEKQPHDRKLNMALQAETLLQHDIALYAFDLFGHGFSEGPRFFIPQTFQNNVQDYMRFCQIVAFEHPETPLFLMGESYGCTLTLHVAKHFQNNSQQQKQKEEESLLPNLDSLILTAPAVIGDLPPRPVVKLLTFLAGYFPLWRPFFMPNPISPERIWRDERVLQIRTNPRFVEMGVDGSGLPFRLGTALNLLRALEDVRTTTIPGLKVPFLILHGTKDYGVPISGSEFLWEHAATRDEDKRFLRKEGAYHDLFADYVAEECMQDVLDWIQTRLKKRKAVRQ